MMREILEIVMLLSLLAGLFFVKNEFAKDRQERLKSGEANQLDADAGHQ